MSDTTITIDEDVKARLALYRHKSHSSWTDALESMMSRLPTMEDIEDGCLNCDCTVSDALPPEQTQGVSHWFSYQTGRMSGCFSNYYCSPACAAEMADEMQSYVPEHPDLVVVGGRNALRVEFGGASFYIDGESREVGIPLPGAFTGTDSHGEYDYEYIGEPVYIKHDERWVQSGIILDIIHEEAHTTLILGYDIEVEDAHRPN